MAAYFISGFLPSGLDAEDIFLEGLAEFFSGDEAVELARALGLAFHFDAAGCVLEINAAGRFIYFLATAA